MSKVKFGLVPPMPGADANGLLNFSVKADDLGFDRLRILLYEPPQILIEITLLFLRRD